MATFSCWVVGFGSESFALDTRRKTRCERIATRTAKGGQDQLRLCGVSGRNSLNLGVLGYTSRRRYLRQHWKSRASRIRGAAYPSKGLHPVPL
jgi:hypothetical protein